MEEEVHKKTQNEKKYKNQRIDEKKLKKKIIVKKEEERKKEERKKQKNLSKRRKGKKTFKTKVVILSIDDMNKRLLFIDFKKSIHFSFRSFILGHLGKFSYFIKVLGFFR